MAAEVAPPTANGNYGMQPSYSGGETAIHAGTSMPINGHNGSSQSVRNDNMSKDEVGWVFVEQYYTTLSRNPERLHLFYAKRSHFVSGVEAEKISVSVGQRAIGERIKDLDIRDCKVRVTNVDSQESGRDIVIQVLGDMSNRSAPPRKFAQTFVLAEQTNGYFVLNDIFRYIAEDDDDESEAPNNVAGELEANDSAPTTKAMPTLTSSDDQVEQEKQAGVVDEKLEHVAPEGVAKDTAGSDVAEEPVADAESPVAEGPAKAAEEATQEAIQPEAPKDPEPSPAATTPEPSEASHAAPAPAEAGPPPKPAAPKSWASLVAANKVAPAVPAVPSTTPVPSQPRAAPPAASSNASVGSTAAVSTTPANGEDQPLPSPGGWQTAGYEHNRRQNRPPSGSVSTSGGDRGNVSAYIKNVTERIDAAALRSTLSKHGKVDYFDVSRQKNAAFVEFAEPAGFQAAVAANPHIVNGEEINVEERRRGPNAYSYNARGGMRGGRGNMDNRTPSQGGRGGYLREGGRGSYTPRGRGNMTPRGRGMPQAA